jgi:hypothetical protein
MNESRRMLQQLQQQLPVRRFANGGPTALFGPPPKEEDTVAPAKPMITQAAPGPMIMQAAPTITPPPAPGPTISAAPAPASTPTISAAPAGGIPEIGAIAIDDWMPKYPPPEPAPTYATRQQIEDIYRNTLGRKGEQAGLDWWTSTAQQANLSPDQLRAEIAKSQEFQQWSPYDIDKSGGISEAERRAAINQVYQNIFAREGEQAGLDYWMQSGLTPQEMQKHFQESAEWGTLSPFDVNVDLRLSPAERAAYEASLLKKPVELPKAREAMELPEAPKPIELPTVEVRDVPEVKPAEIDTKFRESAARTFDPVTQTFQYSAPAKLSPATGAGMTFVPPTVTSRPRQLLNVAFTAGQGGYDPTTGTLYQPAMSASQRYGADRTRQLGALQQAVSQAGFQPSSSGMIRLQNQLRAGGFRKADGTIDTAALQAAVAALKPTAQAGPPAPSPAPTGSGVLAQAARAITSDQSNVPEAFRTLDPIRFSPS